MWSCVSQSDTGTTFGSISGSSPGVGVYVQRGKCSAARNDASRIAPGQSYLWIRPSEEVSCISMRLLQDDESCAGASVETREMTATKLWISSGEQSSTASASTPSAKGARLRRSRQTVLAACSMVTGMEAPSPDGASPSSRRGKKRTTASMLRVGCLARVGRLSKIAQKKVALRGSVTLPLSSTILRGGVTPPLSSTSDPAAGLGLLTQSLARQAAEW